jgi:hypothetical protein
MVAAIFEAPMSREQAERLAGLMVQGRSTRPAGVLNASLLHEGGIARLIAVWRDRDTLDRYLSVAPVPRGIELMRLIGVEPSFRVVEALECG